HGYLVAVLAGLPVGPVHGVVVVLRDLLKPDVPPALQVSLAVVRSRPVPEPEVRGDLRQPGHVPAVRLPERLLHLGQGHRPARLLNPFDGLVDGRALGEPGGGPLPGPLATLKAVLVRAVLVLLHLRDRSVLYRPALLCFLDLFEFTQTLLLSHGEDLIQWCIAVVIRVRAVPEHVDRVVLRLAQCKSGVLEDLLVHGQTLPDDLTSHRLEQLVVIPNPWGPKHLKPFAAVEVPLQNDKHSWVVDDRGGELATQGASNLSDFRPPAAPEETSKASSPPQTDHSPR